MTKSALIAILSICICPFNLAQSPLKAIPASSRSPEQKFPQLSGLTDRNAEASVNALLAEREQQDRAARTDCLHTHPPGFSSSYWESIRVVYLSKRFLSIRVWASWDGCAAYPNYGIAEPLTIDLTHGSEMDWSEFFVDGFQSFEGEKPSPLMTVYLRRAALDPDCLNAVNRADTAFNFWLDGRTHRLMVKPDLPHVVAGCGTLAGIPFSELQGSVRDPGVLKDLLRPTAIAANPDAPSNHPNQ